MIEALFDHVATVYKFSEAVTGGLRAVVNTYAEGPEESCYFDPATFPVRDGRTEGISVIYLRADADVVRNDVLDVTSGPNAPKRLKVLAVARPRGHHIECTCEPFAGVLE